MKKFSNLIFLIIICILFIIIIIFNFFNFNNKILGDNVITLEEIDDIKNSHIEYNNTIALFYKNTIIPYSNTDEFYLFYMNNEDELKKIYSKADFKIKLINKENNHLYHLFIYNDMYYKEVNIEITNIPIININIDNTIDLYGFDANINGLKCEYSIRGDSSKDSVKKGYKLKLNTYYDKKIELELLNMKKSNSWILNPIFFDNSYIREKLSFDIWNELSDDFNHTLEYIELFINNEYQGLYYLEEEVTIDTFDGDKNKDLLISIKGWKSEDDVENMGKEYKNSEYEIEEGLVLDNQKRIELLDSFNEMLNNKDSKIILKYNMDNVINYELFLNFTMARDNTYKNQKIFFKNMTDYYLIEKTIWDVDWAFNNEKIMNSYTDLDSNILNINDIDYDLATPSSIKDDEFYVKRIKDKYFEFREKYYNVDNVNKIISEYCSFLEKSGAIDRDSHRWNNLYYSSSISIIKDFINKRIDVLDKYYEEL